MHTSPPHRLPRHVPESLAQQSRNAAGFPVGAGIDPGADVRLRDSSIPDADGWYGNGVAPGRMDQDRRERIVASAVINAPAAAVYGIIADYRRGHPRILPREFRNLEVEEGGVGDGTLIRFQTRVWGATRTMRAAITEPEPGRVLVEADRDSETVSTFIVDPAPGGQGVRVTIMTDLAVPAGLRGLVERALSPRLLRRIYAAELEKLRALAESGFRV